MATRHYSLKLAIKIYWLIGLPKLPGESRCDPRVYRSGRAVDRPPPLITLSIGLIDLPSGLDDLAQQDRISHAAFDEIICPFTPERAAVGQFLLDNNLRGIVQAGYHPDIDEITLLNIVRISNIDKITVITRRSKSWRSAAKSWFLPDLNIEVPFTITGQWIDQHRDGVLIIDLGIDDDYQFICKPLVREFPHTILYQSNDIQPADCVHWSLLATALFPTMHPVSLLKANGPPHWATKHLNDFALFYNVCLFPQFFTN
jgi:hypothetical protein